MFFCAKKQIILFTLLILTIFFAEAVPVKNDNKTAIVANKINQNASNLAVSYNELLKDVRWFFQRLEDFSVTAIKILPNVSMSEQTRTFSEYTRINFLIGLRHLFTGVKEISITMRKSFEAEQMRQLEYVIHATNIVHEALKILKIWFTNMRVLVGQAFRVYSRYIPEVLLGKCLGRYVVNAYPDRPFYEYPFILLSDIFNNVLDSMITTSDVISPIEIEIEIEKDAVNASTTTESISVEQNEIPYDKEENYTHKSDIKGRALSTDNEDALTSFFNLSDVLDQDKDLMIEAAIEENSWKKCFKLYTAEALMRKLKNYFFETM